MRVELELRNLSRSRVMEYLAAVGGTPSGELTHSGDGWSARLVPMEPAQVGSITVPRDLLVIEGEAAAVEQVEALIRPKTIRGGG